MKNNHLKLNLNCDLGEGMPTDKDVMPYLDLANIACGAHAGDEQSIAQTCLLAKKYQRRVGAHPSYPDVKNFGRISLPLSAQEITQTCQQQIALIQKIAKEIDLHVDYVKPHGALNHDLCVNDTILQAVCHALRQRNINNIMLPLTKRLPAIEKITHSFQLNVIWEVFADRVYEADGTLRSRSLSGAVYEHEEAIYQAVQTMVLEGKVRLNHASPTNTAMKKTSEVFLDISKAQSVCIHGDNPASVRAVKKLRNILDGAERPLH